MKIGKSLQDLSSTVVEQSKAKKDYIADTSSLRMGDGGSSLLINGGLDLTLKMTNVCHRQVGSSLGIPAKYYDRMRNESPSLLSRNVNHWFTEQPKKQMVRTFQRPNDNTARAFLSQRYRPLDNIDLCKEILPIIGENGAEVYTCDLTDTHLYIHAKFPRIEREIKAGDVIQSGVLIKNSEVGMSSLRVQPWVYRLVCSNGMAVADSGVRKYHVGKSLASGDLAYELMSDDTKAQTDKAFWMQVKDVVRSVIDASQFEKIVEAYAQKAQIEVGKPESAVEVVANAHGLSKDEGQTILSHLCSGGDLTQWGLANSVTRLAHDAESYDRAVELEEIGGYVMEMPASAWRN